MNPHLVCFLLSMAGNAAVEVGSFLNYARRGSYPGSYSDWRFWICRSLFVIVAGVLGLACSLSGFSTPLLAFHVGAASTLLVEQMGGKLPSFSG